MPQRAFAERRDIGKVFADRRLAGDRGREVVGEAFVHRERLVRDAERVEQIRLEAGDAVDHGVRALVIDDVGVVGVIALRTLSKD
jgi:hypothetical protein